MANEKQLIRVLTEPTIVLDDITSMDVESGTAKQIGAPSSAIKYSKQYGAVIPLVQILGKVFEDDQVTFLEINSSGELPYCTATFAVNDKSFYSSFFPKDGDLMTVFIRSKDDVFKPIRNDYEISNISINAKSGENSVDTMTISGSLRIPGYDAIKCFSKKGTSMQVIMQTAADLNLGFATNEVDTADEQVWICPFEKTREFIANTTLAAWKDKGSFYTSFVDPFYYLNFVNMEPLFSGKTEIDDAMSIDLLSNDYGKDNVQAKQQTKIVLTNWEETSGTPFHMLKYSLVNNSAAVNLVHGYKRYATYYDTLLQENQSIFCDPITSPESEKDKIILKGRPLENFYLKQVEGKWMGAQYGEDGENCHGNYNFAKINNFQNIVHIGKMGLKVTLQALNPNLRRMQSVPVIITIMRDAVRKKINEPIDEDQESTNPNPDEPNRTKTALKAEEAAIVIDKTISGYYVISEINYVYRKGQFRQELFLIRREWPTPPQTY